ncbi:hypothetical protein [Merismopedia glauca]|uniref:DUF7925 domain-containing protein n=1 Tax=Merismopedia glauca CCAP 1448/3 TaxID=1296344 RepID=A0A2T1C5C6_9CYAN|nr:hypothetical protein [Merismopedia glauca]PSB03485.1 hypothetical protein C7B64_08340 [Merismopedia glauca CCAP 1448/3]
MKKARTKQIYRQVIAASLIAGGAFQLASPVLALTAAGTNISNTATATYEDPDGNPIDATSNTVDIKVAEVAGITVTANGTIEATLAQAGGSAGPLQGNGVIDTGDVVYFDYKITNTGNDPTQFFIPGAPSTLLGGTLEGNVLITEYDPDGPSGPLAPVVLATPISVPAAGILSGDPAALGATNGSIPPGATITIRVPVKVTADTSGAPIKVVIGDTGPNDNSQDTQNQLDSSDGATAAEQAQDVRTVDNSGGTTTPGQEQVGSPQGGEKEASSFQEIFLKATPKAFAKILKTNSFEAGVGATAPNGTITYKLSLDVEKTSPDTAYVAAPLEGSDITLNGSGAERVLVSDVIPTGTTFSSVVTPPTGWTAVYSIDDPAVTGNTALQAPWTTSLPGGGAAAVKRVGFVYDATTTAIPNNDGVEVPALEFKVTTSASANTTIYNIAQVFGQTTPDADTTPGNDTDPLVYDESGDDQPNNYDGPNDPGDNSNITPSDFNTTPTDSEKGIPNPNQGVDNNNNNTGTGPGGEVNPLTINITPPDILNGPDGLPTAVGPTDNNDDFTNKSVDIPVNTAPGSTLDPDPVTFTNTVNNPGTTALTNVLLRPIPPVDKNTADLPDGTLVTITLGANTGVYEYDFPTNTYSLVSGTPVSIATLNPGVSLDYTVTVDLPTVPLSTDDTDAEPGFPVRIVTFTDNNGDGKYVPADDNGNVTIDRIYTGYLKLIKEARILDSTGAPVSGTAGIFTTNGSLLNNDAKPGNRIEYRISYKNISDASTGVGNVVLNANNTVVTEDGTAGGNTWFGPTKDPIYPGNPVGSATKTSGSIVVTDSSGDIKIYVNNVGSVVPSGPAAAIADYDGNLTFQREIQ